MRSKEGDDRYSVVKTIKKDNRENDVYDSGVDNDNSNDAVMIIIIITVMMILCVLKMEDSLVTEIMTDR